jgi:CubicO group peptidase (beta-lactamase class C family)
MKNKINWQLPLVVLVFSGLAFAFSGPFNTPPIFIAPQDGVLEALTEQPFELDIEVEDIDNDIVKIQALHLPDWITFDPYLLQLYGTPDRLDRGTYFVTIKADDGREIRSKRLEIKVNYGHSAQQHLEETVKATCQERLTNLNGVSAAVIGPDGQLVTVTHGHSDVARRQKLDLNHRFRVASITKLFTSTLVMRLVEFGYFELDDHLTDHLDVPGLPNSSQITIRQLLSHTAGVIDHLNHPSFYRGNWKYRTWDEHDIYRFAAVRRARFAPGQGYDYSNTGFYLLGELVEAVLEKPLKEAFREYIFSPAGLNQTTYDDSSDRRHPIDSLADNGRAYEYHLSAVGAAGAIVATPADVARFGHALYNGSLVSKPSLKIMQEDLGFEKGGDHYGLGMRMWDDHGIRHFGHTGALMGYRSILMYLPEYDTTIALSTHHSHYRWYDLVNDVMLEMADYYR